ncbi:hypothetical protein KFL_002730070 [Klebsormidium nitens]|uniref:Transmembrane protein 19 n=1 Tax=Klebsormidium nitens TaxID=105231 RepID=A0A1Y1I9Q2_KLENI|nr:hypothetical protein KFL_002730070 [Klebsormidium nitens]|eukprot:GAQ86149.1 hypothetical protein KFL_002730070 [Klebsormidium nitens]
MELPLSRLLFALLFSAYLARRSIKNKSLSKSGAVAGVLVGFISFIVGFRYGATLVAFYLSSSKLTKYKASVKKTIEAEFKEGGQRNWIQVFANSLVGTVLAISIAVRTGGRDPFFDARSDPITTALLGGYLGFYAACIGDTWSSELGILSTGNPRLVTTLKVVPKGTNGGVSGVGTAASVAGGLFLGVIFYGVGLLTTGGFGQADGAGAEQWKAVPVAAWAGLAGSLVDSLLGATLQYSGLDGKLKKVVQHPGPGVTQITGLHLLNNEGVNFVASATTAALTAGLSLLVF